MVTTDDVLRSIANATYPAGRDDLLEAARAAGAGDDVLKVLQAVPAEEYANSQEVARSVATEEPRDAHTAAQQARQQARSHVDAADRATPPDPLAEAEDS